MLALTDEDVARSAAMAIMAKPASPSVGRAASASAVSPLLDHLLHGQGPEDADGHEHVQGGGDAEGQVHRPGKVAGRVGQVGSPVKLITAKPRKAKKVSATLETMSTPDG